MKEKQNGTHKEPNHTLSEALNNNHEPYEDLDCDMGKGHFNFSLLIVVPV